MVFDYTAVQKIKKELVETRRQISSLLKSDIFFRDNVEDDQNEKIAVYSLTSDRFKYLRPSLKSLLYNSDVDKVIVVTDADKLPADFPKEIECITIKEPPDYLHLDGPNSNTRFKLPCIIRVAFHRLFENYNKILSLDYDTIVRKDISPLWDIQLGDRYYLAGVPETNRTRGSVYGYFPKQDFVAMSSVIFKYVTYVNAGVLLMNLKKLREDGTGDEMIEMINDDEYILPEQDVMNAACHRNIYLLPSDYNSNRFAVQAPNPRIIHYAGMDKKLDYEDVAYFNKMPWSRIKEHRELNYKKDLTLGEEEVQEEE